MITELQTEFTRFWRALNEQAKALNLQEYTYGEAHDRYILEKGKKETEDEGAKRA